MSRYGGRSPDVYEEYRDLFDHAPCGYVSTDASGRITQANVTLANWLGRRDLPGHRFSDLLTIGARIYYETHVSPMLSLRGFFDEVALDLIGDEGKPFPVLINAVERHYDDGALRFVRITIFNASERRRFERELLAARSAGEKSIAELRAAEERRKALLNLSDRFSEHDDAGDLTDIACEVLGRALNVQMVGYGVVDPAAETIRAERDWSSSGVKASMGLLRFRDFGSYIDDLKRGETVVVMDVRADSRTSGHASVLEARCARAFVNAPVFERGRFVSLIYVNTREVRRWSEDDVIFIQEVATRTRAATARRDAENALKTSEIELRQMANALPLLIGIVDRSLTYSFANASYQAWFGYSPEDVVGRTIPEIVGADGFSVRRPMIEKTLAGEHTRLDLDWPWPDGRRRIADIRYLPRRDAKGAVSGFYVFVQDVTAQRDVVALQVENAAKLKRDVKDRTAQLDRVWRLSQELLVVVLPDGTLEAANPRWSELLGWGKKSFGSKVVEYTHPDDLEATLAVFARVFDSRLVG